MNEEAAQNSPKNVRKQILDSLKNQSVLKLNLAKPPLDLSAIDPHLKE